MGMVVEGVRTAKAVHGWAKKLDIDMPITESIYAILFENKDAREAVDLLMGREKKDRKRIILIERVRMGYPLILALFFMKYAKM